MISLGRPRSSSDEKSVEWPRCARGPLESIGAEGGPPVSEGIPFVRGRLPLPLGVPESIGRFPGRARLL